MLLRLQHHCFVLLFSCKKDVLFSMFWFHCRTFSKGSGHVQAQPLFLLLLLVLLQINGFCFSGLDSVRIRCKRSVRTYFLPTFCLTSPTLLPVFCSRFTICKTQCRYMRMVAKKETNPAFWQKSPDSFRNCQSTCGVSARAGTLTPKLLPADSSEMNLK